MSTKVIGSIPWEQLIAQAADRFERPPNSFTFREWMEKTGKCEDAAYRMLNRLIEAGALRKQEGRVLKGGKNERAIFYVPCAR